jgi:hypothetical protein
MLRKIRRLSIWKVPNYFLEPSGAYLGEPVETIDRLNKIRTIAGLAIITGVAVYYSGLSHLTTAANGAAGAKTADIDIHTPEGNWVAGVVVTVVVAMLVLPLVSLYLVARTKREARRAALFQLRWPLIAIGAWFAIFAIASPFIALVTYAQHAAGHMSPGVRGAVWAISLFVLIVEFTWIVKALYLAATGMFRAEDGHPLLPLIAAPLIAGLTALIMNTVGSNGLTGEPGIIGDVLTWGGTVTIFVVSIISRQILKRRYPHDYPFHYGPLTQ